MLTKHSVLMVSVKALVGAFNQEKALSSRGLLSDLIAKTDGSFAALHSPLHSAHVLGSAEVLLCYVLCVSINNNISFCMGSAWRAPWVGGQNINI